MYIHSYFLIAGCSLISAFLYNSYTPTLSTFTTLSLVPSSPTGTYPGGGVTYKRRPELIQRGRESTDIHILHYSVIHLY